VERIEILSVDKNVGREALLDTGSLGAQQRPTYTSDHAKNNHVTAVRQTMALDSNRNEEEEETEEEKEYIGQRPSEDMQAAAISESRECITTRQ